jgi:beta-glucosidase
LIAIGVLVVGREIRTKQVTLKLDRRAFSSYDVKKADWTADAGEFAILVGRSSDNIELRDEFTLTR